MGAAKEPMVGLLDLGVARALQNRTADARPYGLPYQLVALKGRLGPGHHARPGRIRACGAGRRAAETRYDGADDCGPLTPHV